MQQPTQLAKNLCKAQLLVWQLWMFAGSAIHKFPAQNGNGLSLSQLLDGL
jgi:hypothetical protein